MSDFLAMGELLIDFTPSGANEEGIMLFGRNPGGAPANVAVQAQKAGVSSGFIGVVGDDMFGRYLASVLEEEKIDISGLGFSRDFATSLAFVELDTSGNRNFSFYRNPGADTRLEATEQNKGLIEESKVLCFGSLLLTAEPSRSAVRELAQHARSNGVITAYDPNWRPPLWSSEAEGVEMMRSLIPLADIMKVSDEEIALITGEADIEAGANKLLAQGVKLVVATLGPEGCAVFANGISLHRPTYDTRVVDTTGSGDSFFGAFLARVIKSGKALDSLTEAELADFADFANAAGSACATKKGAIPALPTTAQIEETRKNTELLVK